ncbi:SDR family oxidoreductase [Sphingomonas kyeonggiensis]|uniref:Nucleoside-diphosphate-sugar epimerase n=1 Tax=Sphingomonas kyeonggiensis TaxID=1268553 RepID=A0A7W6JQB8_9SPHN|nr:SDR family oxidoreductase [Sphingomonas kyeonggiensis]MBB4097528.1 nucleoside-diphosphate-sugar epimerase [Sphingomonas kyeonggiensis]
MRVFLTGATGFIGSRIVPELLAAGHQVLGLTRSDTGAAALAAQGAEVHRGTLEDLDSLRAGADAADAVIHTAFDHDFANFVANCEKDGRVIAAMGEALKGTGRPLLITSGTGMGNAVAGQPADEDVFAREHPNPRMISEQTGQKLLEAGVDVRVVRLPQVHDTAKQGLITPYIVNAREKGLAAYVGEGANRWPAAHVLDVAKLYVLALDRGEKGARYNAVAEEGIAARTIAETVGAGLGLPVRSLTPEEAGQHFGWLSIFMGLDMLASSAKTRARLGWEPVGPGLIEDLERMDYSAA